MSKVEVLKFGSSVLRSPGDLQVAIDEIYRRWRSGFRVLAVVSAFEGVTDELMAEVMGIVGTECPEATAAYLATGEERTAALLLGSLQQYGLPSRLVNPREIALVAEGPLLESKPVSVNTKTLDRLWQSHAILVLPGFYGVDGLGRIALFGRGGSDLSALFLAAALHANARLLKDVAGVFDTDPARSAAAHRFSSLSWDRAIKVAGPLIQSKALHYAHQHGLAFEVGRPNEETCTHVGRPHDAWAPSISRSAPLRVALLGCGVVGRGVYEALRCYPKVFDVRHVLVRQPERYTDIDHLTNDAHVVGDPSIDVIVVCMGGIPLAYAITATALAAGKFVVSANKAAIASHGESFSRYTRGADRRLWYSAAVGGALPALEALVQVKSPVREIRGIVNSTCGVVLEALGQGKTQADAVAHAKAQGFAEENPTRDLTGQDSADKLALLIEAAFGEWLDPGHIETHGINTITDDPTGYKLIARARRWRDADYAEPLLVASVAPERPAASSFLGQASGPENRLEIELESGEIIRLRAQGAGRWPTTVSILGDLLEVARRVEREREAAISEPITSTA